MLQFDSLSSAEIKSKRATLSEFLLQLYSCYYF